MTCHGDVGSRSPRKGRLCLSSLEAPSDGLRKTPYDTGQAQPARLSVSVSVRVLVKGGLTGC